MLSKLFNQPVLIRDTILLFGTEKGKILIELCRMLLIYLETQSSTAQVYAPTSTTPAPTPASMEIENCSTNQVLLSPSSALLTVIDNSSAINKPVDVSATTTTTSSSNIGNNTEIRLPQSVVNENKPTALNLQTEPALKIKTSSSSSSATKSLIKSLSIGDDDGDDDHNTSTTTTTTNNNNNNNNSVFHTPNVNDQIHTLLTSNPIIANYDIDTSNNRTLTTVSTDKSTINYIEPSRYISFESSQSSVSQVVPSSYHDSIVKSSTTTNSFNPIINMNSTDWTANRSNNFILQSSSSCIKDEPHDYSTINGNLQLNHFAKPSNHTNRSAKILSHERPFQCPFEQCSRRFSRSDELTRYN